MNVEFPDAHLWTLDHQRNNKRSGLKNLRCFPYCGTKHRIRGFCGRSVACVVGCADVDSVVGFGEFTRVRDPPTVSLGDIVSTEFCEQRRRSPDKPFRPWYPGEVSSLGGGADSNGKKKVFEFNKKLKGWHYGWVASKHQPGTKHALRCYFFVPRGVDEMECVGVFDSPEFMFYSRRRTPKVAANSTNAQVKPPAKRKPSAAAAGAAKKRARNDEWNNTWEVVRTNDGSLVNKPVKHNPRSGELDLKQQPRSAAALRTRKNHARKMANVQRHALADVFGPPPEPDVYDEWNHPPSSRSESELSADLAQIDDFFLNAWGEDFAPIVEDTSLNASTKRAMDEYKLWRVLGALTTLDLSRTSGADALLSLSNPTTPPPALHPQVAADDIDDFSRKISDCLDLLLEAPQGMARSVSTSTVPRIDPEIAKMLQELASRLVEEDSFDEAIKVALEKSRTSEVSAKDTLFDVIMFHLSAFLKKYDISLDQLDAKLSASGLMTAKSNELGSSISEYIANHQQSVEQSKVPMSESKTKKHSIAGKWRRDEKTLNHLENIRKKAGTNSNIVIRLLKKMEQHFVIRQTDNVMTLQGRRKMLSSAYTTYILDGAEHPWSTPSPVPNGPAIMLTYRAWADDECVNIVHNYSPTTRLVRKTTRSSDLSQLNSIVKFQRRSDASSDDWQTETEVELKALKWESGGGGGSGGSK